MRHLSRALLVVLAAVALTGCMKMDMGVTVHEDGSAEMDAIFGFSRETIQAMGLTEEEFQQDLIEDSTSDDLPAGAEMETEPYSDDNFVGAHLKVTGISYEDLRDSSEDMPIFVEKDGDAWTFRLPLGSEGDDGGETEALNALGSQAGSQMDVRISATLPGEPVEHNGTRVDGSTVIWEISQETGEFTETELHGRWEPASFPIVPIAATLLAAAVAIGLIVFASKARKPAPDPAVTP